MKLNEMHELENKDWKLWTKHSSQEEKQKQNKLKEKGRADINKINKYTLEWINKATDRVFEKTNKLVKLLEEWSRKTRGSIYNPRNTAVDTTDIENRYMSML